MLLKRSVTALVCLGALSCIPLVRFAVAQTRSEADSSADASVYQPSERELACDRVFNELGESWADGAGVAYDDFKGITFSEAQQIAYDELREQFEKTTEEIGQRAERVEAPDEWLSFTGTTLERPPEVEEMIQETLNTSRSGQWRELNQTFAELGYDRYGQFVGSTTVYYTPEIDQALDEATRDYQEQVLAIMTPEQLPQARINLAGRRRIDAVCNRRGPIVQVGVEDD